MSRRLKPARSSGSQLPKSDPHSFSKTRASGTNHSEIWVKAHLHHAQALLRKRQGKVPKIAQKDAPEAQHCSGCRLRTSPLRSHHNTTRNGISESAKKRGPPRRWIRL